MLGRQAQVIHQSTGNCPGMVTGKGKVAAGQVGRQPWEYMGTGSGKPTRGCMLHWRRKAVSHRPREGTDPNRSQNVFCMAGKDKGKDSTITGSNGQVKRHMWAGRQATLQVQPNRKSGKGQVVWGRSPRHRIKLKLAKGKELQAWGKGAKARHGHGAGRQAQARFLQIIQGKVQCNGAMRNVVL